MKPENVNKIDVMTSVAILFNNENANDARVMKALQRAGITNIHDLCLHSEDDLLAVKNIGQVSITQIASRLDQHGLHLAMTEEDFTTYGQAAAETPTDTPADEQPSGEAQEAAFVQNLLDKMCEDLEQQRLEHRHFNLASDIFLREADGFDSTRERALNAIRKASEFMDVYYKD